MLVEIAGGILLVALVLVLVAAKFHDMAEKDRADWGYAGWRHHDTDDDRAKQEKARQHCYELAEKHMASLAKLENDR